MSRTLAPALARYLAVGVAATAAHWALLALRITPESVYLLPYASMLIIASFVYAAQRRFAARRVVHGTGEPLVHPCRRVRRGSASAARSGRCSRR